MPRPKKNATATTTAVKAQTAAKAEAAPAEAVKTEPVKQKPGRKPRTSGVQTAVKPAAPAKRPAAAKAAEPAAPKKRAGRKPRPVTVDDVVAKTLKRINKDAAKKIMGKAAVDIKLYGAFEAHMYIEVKDGKATVAPYDYIEKDVEAAVPVDVAVAIADGKVSVKEAVENGSLYVFGNLQFALKLAELFK